MQGESRSQVYLDYAEPQPNVCWKRMNYIPSSYFDFLENEAEKLNKLAQRHKGEINPSDFYDFYSEMMSYYKSKVDRWTGILERLEWPAFAFYVNGPKWTFW